METQMENLTKKKRGRPKGVKNGQGNHALAPIQDWTPAHESVVQLHLANYDNSEIATTLGYTVGRVSQILQDPRAKIAKHKILQLMQSKMEESITSRLVQLADHSVTRLTETIITPCDVGSRAKMHQDNIALNLVKGFLPQINIENPGKSSASSMDSKLAERLITALEKSNEVSKLDVQEADYVIEK
jgi:hypothetical protein